MRDRRRRGEEALAGSQAVGVRFVCGVRLKRSGIGLVAHWGGAGIRSVGVESRHVQTSKNTLPDLPSIADSTGCVAAARFGWHYCRHDSMAAWLV